MKISVVVPTHDTRQLTLRCLAALRQAGGEQELVVVDDGSTDGTADAVRALEPGARLLREPEAAGFTAAVNHGATLATGDLLLFLNSDTEVDPGALDRLATAFAADPRLGVAGAMLRYPDGRAQWSGGRAPSLPWLFLLGSGLAEALSPFRPRNARSSTPPAVDWVSGAALAVRAPTWREIGPFDPHLRFYAQDLDLCLRARAAGWAVRLLAEFGVVHHHGATVSRRPGAAVARHPEWLLADLLRWAEKTHGAEWRRRAARRLAAGTDLRLLGRRLRRPLLAAAARPEHDRGTAAWAAARRALHPFLASGPTG